MLERPQEGVPSARRDSRRPTEPRRPQPPSAWRVRAEHLRPRCAVRQLQVLDEELDVADGAHARLDLAPSPPRVAEPSSMRRFWPATSSRTSPAGRPKRSGCASRRKRAKRPVAGDGPGAQERLALPGAGGAPQVREVRLDARHEWPRAPPGPQAKVHPVQVPRRGGAREAVGDGAGQAGALRRGRLGEKDEVHVGGIVQFSPAEFAEGQNGQPPDPRALDPRRDAEHCPDQPLGERREPLVTAARSQRPARSA